MDEDCGEEAEGEWGAAPSFGLLASAPSPPPPLTGDCLPPPPLLLPGLPEPAPGETLIVKGAGAGAAAAAAAAAASLPAAAAAAAAALLARLWVKRRTADRVKSPNW